MTSDPDRRWGSRLLYLRVFLLALVVWRGGAGSATGGPGSVPALAWSGRCRPTRHRMGPARRPTASTMPPASGGKRTTLREPAHNNGVADAPRGPRGRRGPRGGPRRSRGGLPAAGRRRTVGGALSQSLT